MNINKSGHKMFKFIEIRDLNIVQGLFSKIKRLQLLSILYRLS